MRNEIELSKENKATNAGQMAIAEAYEMMTGMCEDM